MTSYKNLMRLTAALVVGLTCSSAALASTERNVEASVAHPGHLRLVHDLDRPQDGYCMDIVGSGDYVRFDMPITAHNCKPGLYSDEAVVLDQGRIVFPAYGVCATAAGLNGKVLAHAALVPKRCDEKSPFLIAGPMQKFTLRKDGYLQLEGTSLCVTAGAESESTFEPTHRWRALYMDKCDVVDPQRATWKFVVP